MHFMVCEGLPAMGACVRLPRFMAPEVMSSETYPSSDLWAAGVMAYQLLSGTLPFDDRRKPHSPALSVVW